MCQSPSGVQLGRYGHDHKILAYMSQSVYNALPGSSWVPGEIPLWKMAALQNGHVV